MTDIVSLQQEESLQMGLRERKKRLVQATIEETALRLFQQHGYDQTSIQDIADAVMMSPRTFFRYFSFKEDILFAPTQTLVNDGIRYLQSVPPTALPLAALTATFLYIASQYEERKDTFIHSPRKTPAFRYGDMSGVPYLGLGRGCIDTSRLT